MPGERTTARLTCAFAASVVVHALALFPGPRGALFALVVPPAMEPPPPPERDLGIDTGSPMSVDWLGYDEPEEHLAPTSDVDQAMFAEAPGAAATPPSAPLQADAASDGAMTTESTEALTIEIAQAPDVPARPEAVEAPTGEQQPPPAIDLEEARAALAALMAPVLDQLNKIADDAVRMTRDEQASAAGTPAPEAEPSAANPPSPTDPPVPQQNSPARPAVAPVSTPQPTPRSTPGDAPGDLADKQSDAASRIDVPAEHWKAGKPLAAHGIELKPKRPSFTLLTRMTAIVQNPLCRLEFDSRGKVVRAIVLESSGDSRVDGGLLDSLYGWRAAGSELDAIGADGILPIDIRIVLVD